MPLLYINLIIKNKNKMLLTDIQENQMKWIVVKQVRHSLDKWEKTQRTENGNDFSILATSKSVTIYVFVLSLLMSWTK